MKEQNWLKKYFQISIEIRLIDRQIRNIAIHSFALNTKKTINKIIQLYIQKQRLLNKCLEFSKMFSNLNKRTKAIIYLIYVKKLTFKQISQHLGISDRTCFRDLKKEGIVFEKR